jgi:hypothetical protein
MLRGCPSILRANGAPFSVSGFDFNDDAAIAIGRRDDSDEIP